MNNNYELEKRSCAVSLSDMEIFVFPEIMFSLVLANIMSPRIWKWLDDPWFSDIDSLKSYKKIQRLRQYIMDNYTFNLDLDTWGLTTKDIEIERFRDFIDMDILKNSNALFGYEGDKYYFDIDIRKHFGLDKYTTDVIPYWKTETVEAMDAFKHKTGHSTGAGECVSLAALWAAALFIICKIPLEDIFMMATPLHSQNFVIARDGIITNNRRIVTRNMWVNGTELSAKARRALENERVTIVSHISGHVHVMYNENTIDKKQYERFKKHINEFLDFELTIEVLCNFLRYKSALQKCFQLEHEKNGTVCHIALERVFAYEHSGPYSIIGPSRRKLLDEIDEEEFHIAPVPGRIVLNRVEDFLLQHNIDTKDNESMLKLKDLLTCGCFVFDDLIKELKDFCVTVPRLPVINESENRMYEKPITINTSMDRQQIAEHLESMRHYNRIAEYSFYAARNMIMTDHAPFIKAAVERNPVCIEGFRDISINDVIKELHKYNDDSIYDESFRLAQPDEVFNYKKGDGLEKALLLAVIIKSRHDTKITITLSPANAELSSDIATVSFPSEKNIPGLCWSI